MPKKVAQQVSSTRREQDNRARMQHRGAHCKAQSAMQGPLVAPQTRSTATALVVAPRGKHNLGHAKLPLWQAERKDA
jgi:hypothetical protein